METQNLWPDFPTEEINGPKAILKEQAKYLSDKTNNVLSADIETTQYKGKMIHDFYVVAPELHNYRYRLLRIEHAALNYPSTVIWDEEEDYNEQVGFVPTVNDEQELVEYLRRILNDSSTVKIVSSLLSQSLAEKADHPF